MRVLLQRVSQGSVTVEGKITGSIDQGLVLLVGICAGDDPQTCLKMARKVVNMRIFSEDGRFSKSLLDVGGGALVVSQFTLYADTRKGRRPSFIEAAPPETAQPLVDHFARCLQDEGVARVECGVFGASMKIALCNEGPVTIWLDSADMARSSK